MSKPANLWLVGKHGGDELAGCGRRPSWRDGLSRFTAWTRIGLPVLLVALFVLIGWLYGNVRQARGVAPGTGQNAPVPAPPKRTFGMRANGGDDLKAGAQDSNTIQVDVHGDVVHPGVVTVPWNSRVDDAIEAAGGFRDKADAMDVNSAALVWDGEEIDVPGQMGAQARAMTSSQVARATEQSLVPSPEANGVSDAPSGEGKPLVTDKIDLNTADEATLETLPRVGPKRAADIVAYRQAHGPFQSVSDLLNVKGIGPKTLSLWAPNLYVASALAPKEDR